MDQIRKAFTLEQFIEVSKRVFTSPERILEDASSPLQIEAATLVMQLTGNQRRMEEVRSKLKLNNVRYRRHRKECPCFLADSKQDFKLNSTKKVHARFAKLRSELESSFQTYLNESDFLLQSSHGWLEHVTSLRNVLRNDHARFEIAHSKAVEYSLALKALSAEDTDRVMNPDLEAELRLRTAALAHYTNQLLKLEENNADFTATFNKTVTNRFGNTTVGSHGKYDSIFSITINEKIWSFGTLEVLNRRTMHFLSRCFPAPEDNADNSPIPSMAEKQTATSVSVTSITSKLSTFLYKAAIGARARATLEVVALKFLRRVLRAADNNADAEAFKPRQSIDVHLFTSESVSGITRPTSFRWSSTASNNDYVEELLEAFRAEAARPTFESFPTIILPSRILVSSNGGMARDAILRTAAPAGELFKWGFRVVGSRSLSEHHHRTAMRAASIPPAADKETGEIIVHFLLSLDGGGPAERGQRMRDDQATHDSADSENGESETEDTMEHGSDEGQQDGEGQGNWRQRQVVAALACPTDIWDEPPNDVWHHLARKVAQSVWDRHEAAVLAEDAG
jgi:hypothetical protein